MWQVTFIVWDTVDSDISPGGLCPQKKQLYAKSVDQPIDLDNEGSIIFNSEP